MAVDLEALKKKMVDASADYHKARRVSRAAHEQEILAAKADRQARADYIKARDAAAKKVDGHGEG